MQEKIEVTPPGSLRELFFGFLAIGARSFGGVLPWAHRTMVEERRWMTQADFAETIGLCQFLPGPNIGNASIVLGKRWFGVRGSIVAFLGLFALPFFWVMALGILYLEWATNPVVRAVVTGVGATGAGLFMATAIKLGRAIVRKPAALALVAGCFLCVGVGRVSMLLVMPIGAAIGVWAARRGWL
ncbi:MAG TPA: chromate transporter [Burkholderiales bacterium]|nr:chromate transporter [Burkholderiales bacterium]